MPKVTFVSEALSVECQPGQTIREVAQAQGIVLERGYWTWSNCRGLGVCGSCKVWVKPLADRAMSDKDFWERLHPGVKGQIRLGCRARILGDCEIRTKPGGEPVKQTLRWDPDPRPSRWKDRLEGKEEPEPAKKAEPVSEVAAPPVAGDPPAKAAAPAARVDPPQS